MAWEFTYCCDRCRLVQRVRTGDYRFYVVPWQGEGVEFIDRVPCSDQEGWCHRCRRLRPVESIPDITLLERMKAAMAEASFPQLDRELLGADHSEQEELQRRLTQIDDWIRWRNERMSSPKCLTCGSTEVEPMEKAKRDDEEFRHPGCGGVFRICEDPCHIQPAVGFLIPAEGPQAARGWRLLLEWVQRRIKRGN